MNIKTEFTEDEWFLLSSTPALIGAAMSTAAPSGIIGTIKELSTSVRSSVQGLEDYPDSPLITALLQRAENWDEAKTKAQDYRERTMARLQSTGDTSREKLHEEVLKDCTAAAQLVDEKCTSTDAKAYKEWSVKIARKVAEAAKEGGVLGFGGERVSAAEVVMLAKIEAALDVPSGQLYA